MGVLPVTAASIFTFTTFDVPFTPGFSPVNTQARAINIFRLIVGDYADSSDTNVHGYLRDADGQFTPIDVPFPGAFQTSPRDINVTGAIVGQYRDAAGLHCFVLAQDIFTTIDVQGLPNAVGTSCRGINASGEIVGRFRDSSTGLRHGFLFSRGVFT